MFVVGSMLAIALPADQALLISLQPCSADLAKRVNGTEREQVLGSIEGSIEGQYYEYGYHDITRYPEAAQIPGLLMIRWDAPLFFANANIFRNMVRKELAKMDPKPYWVLVAAEPVTDVDTTAAEILVDLDEELNASDIHLAFAELKEPVKEEIVRFGLLETIDYRHFYPTLETAVAAFHEERQSSDETSTGVSE